MQTQNQQRLIAEFPSLYRLTAESPMVSPMSFGFEVGDGWYDLIHQLSADLMVVCPETVAGQVKEKFGGLRFYVDFCNDRGYELISEAEAESYNLCEACGKPGYPSKKGWTRTLCSVHHLRRDQARMPGANSTSREGDKE